MMQLPSIHSAEGLARLVDEIGFLPFFKNEISGFSVEECTPPELWFSDSADGPWEWKGPAIQLSHAGYGKLFGGKAGFVSREWYPDFANYRRDGYDYDSRYNDGLSKYKDMKLIETVERTGPILSKKLKIEAGYGGKNGLSGFDSIITRQQMQCYLLTANFEYATTKDGRPYGWGLAVYAMPEQFFGPGFSCKTYAKEPTESYNKMICYLNSVLKDSEERKIKKLLG